MQTISREWNTGKEQKTQSRETSEKTRTGGGEERDKMITMYEASDFFGGKITKLEFIRKTKSGESVVYMSGRDEIKRRIKTDWRPLFDTFDAAKQWLIQKKTSEISNIRYQLEKELPLRLRQEKSRLANLEKLTESDCK